MSTRPGPLDAVPEIGFDWVMVPVAAIADAVWRVLHMPMPVALDAPHRRPPADPDGRPARP